MNAVGEQRLDALGLAALAPRACEPRLEIDVGVDQLRRLDVQSRVREQPAPLLSA